MRHKIVFTMFAACLTRIFAQSAGSIAGTVVSADSNTPLAGAAVLIVGHQPTGAPIFFETATGKDGSYLISSIPSGDYAVCAQYNPRLTAGSRYDFWATRAGLAEEVAYLPSCDWSQGQPKATVSTGQAAYNIRLQRGVNVSVLVDDPSDLLDAASGSSTSLQINLLDASGNVRGSLPLLYNIAGLRRYGTTLPTGSSYSLDVRTQGISLIDSAGGSVYPTAFRVPVQAGTRSVLAAHFKLQK